MVDPFSVLDISQQSSLYLAGQENKNNSVHYDVLRGSTTITYMPELAIVVEGHY